jgi:PKD repeat protein
MRQLFSFLAAVLIFSYGTNAQKIYKDYQDGALYVKLKSYYNPKTREAMVPNYKFDLNNLPFVNKVDSKFGITHFGRAFNIDAGEKLNSTMVLEFANAALVDELIASLKYDPFVEYAEKVPLNKIDLTPNDPQLSSLWHLTKINAISAWNYASSGSNIVIAVVDDAIQRTHPDLAPNLWVNPGEIPGNGVDDDGNGFIDDINGWDVAGNSPNVDPPSDEFDHGTHVAGISSAATDNGIGIASIGFSCKLMCIKATNSASNISAGYTGVLYAANNGAHIINMSWGGSGSSTTTENVINYALGRGCILVASAGNDNSSALKYPAAYQGVISVASTGVNDEKSDFSNYGSWVRISAPGSSIRSTIVGSSYGNKSGTSMASPMVAGLLGLMKFLNPGMPNEDLIQCLYSSADAISSFPGEMGAGRINADKAMACVAGSLNLPPVPDFVANNTTIPKQGFVAFTDQSSYNPTSWLWSFPGGSPATFNGKTPPTIRYDNVGEYSVSLTVTNAFGSNTTTKTNYIKVIEPPACLRVNLPFPDNWTTVNYTVGTNAINGFVNGVNRELDRQKAMFFNLSATNNTHLTSVAIFFGRAYSDNPNKIVTVRILNGTSGNPTGAAVLGTSTLTMSEIMEDVTASRSTFIDFPQSIVLPASKSFFVSVDISNLEWENSGVKDTLSIFSNVSGESATTPIWDQSSDFVWRRYGTSGTWNLIQASLLIHPFVTSSPARSVLNPKNPAICSGNIVELSAEGSIFNDLFQWQLPGAAAPQIINNQILINPLYPNPGSYKAYLLTRGACNEVRVDSTVITVNPSPSVNVSSSKNPICVGESATLTASGASAYTWSPATNLNGNTGSQVIANPVQTISYSITGTTGSCSTNATFELRVRANITDVSLSASVESINGPTSVTFTAAPENGGENPIFNFFVNNISQQTGASSVFSKIVSPGDRIKCELTSSEPCVVEKVASSNEITMGNVLPVTLFNFIGKRTANGNALSWITSSEANSDRFVIERSMEDQNFITIGQIAAAGNSNTNQFYNYLDAKPLAGRNFYRLKMVDKDGTFKFSDIVVIDNNAKLIITNIQPNPAPRGTNGLLNITDGERGIANITLSNVAGQVLQSYRVSNPTGNVQVPLSTATLASGTYLVTYRNSKGKIVETIRWTIIR